MQLEGLKKNKNSKNNFLKLLASKGTTLVKIIFPLEKVKILKRILPTLREVREVTKVKHFFFVFLDELDHFKHRIKSVSLTLDPPHFFYFEGFPYTENLYITLQVPFPPVLYTVRNPCFSLRETLRSTLRRTLDGLLSSFLPHPEKFKNICKTSGMPATNVRGPFIYREP